jgi:hypothetical protein
MRGVGLRPIGFNSLQSGSSSMSWNVLSATPILVRNPASDSSWQTNSTAWLARFANHTPRWSHDEAPGHPNTSGRPPSAIASAIAICRRVSPHDRLERGGRPLIVLHAIDTHVKRLQHHLEAGCEHVPVRRCAGSLRRSDGTLVASRVALRQPRREGQPHALEGCPHGRLFPDGGRGRGRPDGLREGQNPRSTCRGPEPTPHTRAPHRRPLLDPGGRPEPAPTRPLAQSTRRWSPACSRGTSYCSASAPTPRSRHRRRVEEPL